MSTTDHDARWRRVQARMDAAAVQRHAARIAEAKAKAVPPPAAAAALGEVIDRMTAQLRSLAVTEVAPPAGTPVAESAPVAEPAKPLHEMSPDEFRHHVATAWDRAGEYHRPLQPRPAVSLGQFLRDGS